MKFVKFNDCVFDTDESTGKARSIKRIYIKIK